LTPEDFKRKSGKPVVLDCWRILPREKFERVVDYLTLGYGEHQVAHASAERVMAAEGD
jgi:hypothetical protein